MSNNVIQSGIVSKCGEIDFSQIGSAQHTDKDVIVISHADERQSPDAHFALKEFALVYKNEDGDFEFHYCIDNIDDDPLKIFLLEALKNA